MDHQKIETALIDPGKPWQNGVGESFNGKFRDECLSLEWFLSRAQAKVVIEAWRRHYNHHRPHDALGLAVPADRYRSSPRRFSSTVEPFEYCPHDIVRRVDAAARISFAGRP